jgi:outer membrane receptor protein involved in Fe transport
VANRRAPAVKGAYSPEEALKRLLAGSGIVAKRTGPNVVVLQSASAANGQPIDGSAASRPFGDDAAVAIATSDDAAAAPPITLGEVTVTGSNIRGAPPAAPLRVVSQSQLQASGHATLADALRALPENFSGGASEGNSLTGGDGLSRNITYGSALNLRGLGNNATLVLLNGRRVAGSGSFADFVDVSMIPTTAVERVEVLLDGASAVYGADAVGGVVNVILRRKFDGAETQLFAGVGTAGEPAQGRLAHTFGRRWTDGGLVVSYELQRRQALRTKDRDFARSADLRPFGGGDFRVTNAFPGNILGPDPVTGGNAPRFAIPAGQPGTALRPTDFQAGTVNYSNPRLGADVLPRQTQNSIYVSLDQTWGALELTADARYAYRRFKAYLTPVVSTFTVGRGNPFFVSPTGAATHTIAYTWYSDLGNPQNQGSAETLGLSLGAKLPLFRDWRGEAYATFDQEIAESRGFGFINSLVLGEALGNIADRADTPYSAARDGFFNPFTGIPGANIPNVVGAIGSGRVWSRIRSRVAAVNIQADGAVLQLPGGPLKLAVGASARREFLVRTGDNWLSTPAPVRISNPTDAERDVIAAFAEARVPLFGPDNARPGLYRLELSVAGRVEHYDVAGSTANPSVGVVWEPTAGLRLRSTFSRSFRAPALREQFDPASVAPTLLAQGPARIRVLTLNGGNPDLDPETAKSWTAGFDLAPVRWPGLKLSATFYDVRFENRIGRPAATNLANALTDPTLAPFVTRISPATSPADLALINAALASAPFVSTGGAFPPTDYGAIIDNRYVNTTTLHVRGIDVSASYAFDVSPDDRVSLGAAASYMLDYDQQFTPTAPTVDRVNIANFPLRMRGRLTADWTHGRLTLAGAANYTGRYRDSRGERIGDFVSFDAQVRLAPAQAGLLKGLAVRLNVRNVFDRDPPFYNNTEGFAYDPANADTIGRFVSLQLTRAW